VGEGQLELGQVGGLGRGAQVGGGREIPVAGLLVVVRERLRLGVRTEQRDGGLGHHAVPVRSLAAELHLVGGVTDQRVAEPHAVDPVGLDQPGPLQEAERRPGSLRRDRRAGPEPLEGPVEHLHRELPTDHGRHLRDGPARAGGVESGLQQCLHPLRQVAAGVAGRVVRCGGGGHDEVLREQRDPFAAVGEHGRHVVIDGPACQRPHHLHGLVLVQGRDLELLARASGQRRGEALGA
jgi:hypothetical protein